MAVNAVQGIAHVVVHAVIGHIPVLGPIVEGLIRLVV